MKAVEFSVLRFSDDEVLEQINQVMHRIEDYVEEFAARNGFEKNY